MNKITIASILLTILAIGGIFVLLRNNPQTDSVSNKQTNIAIVDGKQIIRITAKGGYAPRITKAQANMPTVIQVQTNGTYDCSSALTIPAVGFRAMLPASGVTPIEVPPQRPGTTLKGVCSMGMYNFAINFN